MAHITKGKNMSASLFQKIDTNLHFSAFNPKSPDYIRRKYKKKLQQFQETCELIKYLGDNMTRRYKEPRERPIDFDFKMQRFMELKELDRGIATWVS